MQAAPSIYRLKVTLNGVAPPVWRLVEVPGSVPLSKLHRILQAALGWENYHAYFFAVGTREYGPPGLDPEGMHSDRAARLANVAPIVGARFDYHYDLGDRWQHSVVVEAIAPLEGAGTVRCLAGARACPPEDCGGYPGYEEFLAAIKDRRHPRHKELREWIGGNFDPEAFDLSKVNAQLRRIR